MLRTQDFHHRRMMMVQVGLLRMNPEHLMNIKLKSLLLEEIDSLIKLRKREN